jgi:hypothetical protein
MFFIIGQKKKNAQDRGNPGIKTAGTYRKTAKKTMPGISRKYSQPLLTIRPARPARLALPPVFLVSSSKFLF